LTGETGTGKSFLLRVLSILLRSLSRPLDTRALEEEFTKEFGHPGFALFEGADEGKVELYYEGEVLVSLKIHKRPISPKKLNKLCAEFIEIEREGR
jgi:energy-coupling factor transporter ATP-binding protein EcfA2